VKIFGDDYESFNVLITNSDPKYSARIYQQLIKVQETREFACIDSNATKPNFP